MMYIRGGKDSDSCCREDIGGFSPGYNYKWFIEKKDKGGGLWMKKLWNY